MTKENKELEFIAKEIKQAIEVLEKRETLNGQVIDELDKQLAITKYGSVGHVNKITRLSSLRNYKLRLKEVIDVYKQITDYKSVETIESYIVRIIEDTKTNLKASSAALDTVEMFSNDYVKNEILVKTYKELSDLYDETLETLKKIREGARPEVATPVEQVSPQPTEEVPAKANKKEMA